MRPALRIIATIVIGLIGVASHVLASWFSRGRSELGAWWTYIPVFALWAIFGQFVWWQASRARQRRQK